MLRTLTELASDLLHRLGRRYRQPGALSALGAEAVDRWRAAGLLGLLLWLPAARGGTRDYRLWLRLFGRPGPGDSAALQRVTVVVPIGSAGDATSVVAGLQTTLATLGLSAGPSQAAPVRLTPLDPVASKYVIAWLRSRPPGDALPATVSIGSLGLLGGSIGSVGGSLGESWGGSIGPLGGSLGRADAAEGSEAAAKSASSSEPDDWIVVIPSGTRMPPGALERLAKYLHAPAKLVYVDDDVIGPDRQPCDPHFKPDWDPVFLSAAPYTGPVVAVRRGLLPWTRLQPRERPAPPALAWGDLIAREAASQGFTAQQVAHVPEVLAHLPARFERPRPAEPGPTPHDTARTGGRIAARTGGRISVVIPTRDRPELLARCLEGLAERTDYPDFEVIVVDNGSESPEALRVLSALEGERRILVLRQPGPFNFAALCNAGVAAATGSLVLLMNDDVDPQHPGWLSGLVRALAGDRVAAAGPKLLYPDGRIQHAGIVLGIDGSAGHAHKGLPGDTAGYMGRARFPQQVSAVTAACMLVDRAAYETVGGMDAGAFPVAFNDMDLCLRLGSHGWRVVFCPDAVLVHHESASRGTDLIGPARTRFEADVRRLRDRWGPLLDDDPFYNPSLSLEREDFSLAWPPRRRDDSIARHPDVRGP